MIIFLDFDGVLHPVGTSASSDQAFCKLPHFEGLLRLHPSVDVVLSTSWRVPFDFEDLVSNFSADLRDRVVEVTPKQLDLQEVPSELRAYPRHAECWSWLRMNRKPLTSWLALDDEPWRFLPFCKQLYLTDPTTGLSTGDIHAISTLIAATSSFGELP